MVGTKQSDVQVVLIQVNHPYKGEDLFFLSALPRRFNSMLFCCDTKYKLINALNHKNLFQYLSTVYELKIEVSTQSAMICKYSKVSHLAC